MIEKLIDLIKKVITTGFYGKITIQFEKGNIVRIVKEESIKL